MVRRAPGALERELGDPEARGVPLRRLHAEEARPGEGERAHGEARPRDPRRREHPPEVVARGELRPGGGEATREAGRASLTDLRVREEERRVLRALVQRHDERRAKRFDHAPDEARLRCHKADKIPIDIITFAIKPGALDRAHGVHREEDLDVHVAELGLAEAPHDLGARQDPRVLVPVYAGENEHTLARGPRPEPHREHLVLTASEGNALDDVDVEATSGLTQRRFELVRRVGQLHDVERGVSRGVVERPPPQVVAGEGPHLVDRRDLHAGKASRIDVPAGLTS